MSLAREALLWLIIIILLSVLYWKCDEEPIRPPSEKKKAKSPGDCLACVEEVPLARVNVIQAKLPPAWETRKGPGGPKKTVETQGHACNNKQCAYFNIRDASLHALAGNGIRGQTDSIQRLVCQACGNRFSIRRDTALKDLKTDPQRIELAMTLAAEGVTSAVIARALGHCEETITRWLERAAKQARLLHDYYFQNLEIPYLQVDELQTKIRAWPGQKA